MAKKEEINYKELIGNNYLVYDSRKGIQIEKDKDSPQTFYCRFKFEGKFNPLGLEELKKEGYKKVFPPRNYQRLEQPMEFFSYSTKSITITLSANYEKNFHEIAVHFDEEIPNEEVINKIKSNLENILEKKLTNLTPFGKNLAEDISEN